MLRHSANFQNPESLGSDSASPDTQGTIRDIATTGLGTAVATALALFFQLSVARSLGPSEYADVAAALALLSVLTFFASPVNGMTTRFVAREVAGGDLSAARGIYEELANSTLRLLAIWLPLSLLVSWPVMVLFQFQSWITISLTLCAVGVLVSAGLPRGAARGLRKYQAYSLSQILEASLRVIVWLAFAATVASSTTAILSMIIGTAFASVLLHRQVSNEWKGVSPTPANSRELRNFAPGVVIFYAANALLLAGDILIAKVLFSPHDAGVFGAAAQLARIPVLALSPLLTVALPEFSRANANSTSRRPVCLFGLLSVCLLFPIAAIAVAPESWLIEFLLGESYAGAGTLLVPLLFARILAVFSTLMGLHFIAACRFRFLFPWALTMTTAVIFLGTRPVSALSLAWTVAATSGVVLLSTLCVLALPASGSRAVSASAPSAKRIAQNRTTDL